MWVVFVRIFECGGERERNWYNFTFTRARGRRESKIVVRSRVRYYVPATVVGTDFVDESASWPQKNKYTFKKKINTYRATTKLFRIKHVFFFFIKYVRALW